MRLTERQRALLSEIPDEQARFHRRRGLPHMIGNPTVHALLNRRLIEIDTVPPRWRRTDLGRAALAQSVEKK